MRALLTSALAIVAPAFGFCSYPTNAEEAHQQPHGCEVGAEVPTFFVREVTGRQPNLAVCLVCRYAERPVVLVICRRLDDQVESLLVSLDRQVDASRGDGLRGFAAFLADDSDSLQPRLTTLARRRELSLPLVIPVESVAGPRSLELPEDASTVVLFYRERRIAAAEFIDGDALTPARIEAIIEQAKGLLAAGPGK